MSNEAKTVHLSNNRTASIEQSAPTPHTNGGRVALVPSKRKPRVLITAEDAMTLARELNDADRLTEVADNIKRAAYYANVRSYAESIIEDVASGEIEDREALIERMDQDADGAACVIYTHQAIETLLYSDNDGAYVDDFGTDGIVSDGSINWSVLAYAAFRADIAERVSASIDINEPFECMGAHGCGDKFDSFSDLADHVESDHLTECEDCGKFHPIHEGDGDAPPCAERLSYKDGAAFLKAQEAAN